jgi:hypothetical protein
MPYIIKPRRVRNIALASFAATLLIGVLPAAANAECPSQPTSLRFQESGDNSEYSPVPGGTFEEAGAPGWSLNNAAVTTESEGPEGSSGSLVIQPGGVAVSPAFCVSRAYPSFRFFARQLSGGGVLSVRLRYAHWFYNHEIPVASLQGGTSWALSPALELASKLFLWGPGSTASVELVFESSRPSWFDREGGGTWAIDDVYVDPYRR